MAKLNFFNYIGGKHYMLNEIYANLDYSKECFIELFGGSGKVILNLNKKVYQSYIFNDLDKNIYNLFNVVKNNFDEFKELVKIPYDENIFKDLVEKYRKGEITDNVERAAVFYFILNSCFSGSISGLKPTISVGFIRNKSKAYSGKVRTLSRIYEQLQNIIILSRDYKDILNDYSYKGNLMIYVDPPYKGTEYYYNAEFTEQDHKELAEMLNKSADCGNSIMLSYYEYPELEEYYPEGKWNYMRFSKAKYGCGVTKINPVESKPPATELLIVNYKLNSLL